VLLTSLRVLHVSRVSVPGKLWRNSFNLGEGRSNRPSRTIYNIITCIIIHYPWLCSIGQKHRTSESSTRCTSTYASWRDNDPRLAGTCTVGWLQYLSIQSACRSSDRSNTPLFRQHFAHPSSLPVLFRFPTARSANIAVADTPIANATWPTRSTY